tara:strand:- start:5094 stop:5894 length:801 start_codon:yes stop_codon:yes gene_type:complete
MSKEQFSIAASRPILDLIDRAGDQAGLSRGQAFEDFLTCTRCALGGQTMEDEYLSIVTKGYDKGEPGRRGIDHISRAFGLLVKAMEDTGQDVLGDIFTGGITYGERGQFFTPDCVTDLVSALMTGGDAEEGSKQNLQSINDPACGSGRFLLSMGKQNPRREFVGQDVDHRCAQMTAINLGLNGLRGWAVWQNTLSLECFRVYKIGMFFNGAAAGVIREVPKERSPFHYTAIQNLMDRRQEIPDTTQPADTMPDAPNPCDLSQLDLF